MELNAEQQLAVTAATRYALVLAGAGTGKTRVLVHRIAWLIEHAEVAPHQIMAVTFTNKAATEMRDRLSTCLAGRSLGGYWVGTFHGLAHRLLRIHYEAAGLPAHFQVLDSEDQRVLVKRQIRALKMDVKVVEPRPVQWWINQQKDEGLRSDDIDPDELDDPSFWQVYRAYEQACNQAGLVDFAELLLRSHELLRDNPVILGQYRARFRHVLVDEFQDTNVLQYAWLRLLAGEDNSLFVVGDDDQSIYGWRGARMDHVHDFERRHQAQLSLIRLEQNYRSSAAILTAANAVIDHNEDRLGKSLWTDQDKGEPVLLCRCAHEAHEADQVVAFIQQWHRAGKGPLSSTAILYRSNSQSRVFEEYLNRAGLPYRVYGGLRFFERAEIKDVLSYLRVLKHPDDDVAMQRIINLPPRGIGATTLGRLLDQAAADSGSLWQAMQQAAGQGRAGRALTGVVDLLQAMMPLLEEANLADTLQGILDQVPLLAHYRKHDRERADARADNLEELLAGAVRFDVTGDEDKIDAFLALAALDAGDTDEDPDADRVQLMTLHSAKGLEFDLVFMAGMEDGLFPNQRAMDEGMLEEERRLCYVGMTRARKQLVLCHADQRRRFRDTTYCHPSRFLKEVPEDAIQLLRGSMAPVSRQALHFGRADTDSSNWRIGQRVQHAHFGEGVVLGLQGRGEEQQIRISFSAAGEKWLLLSLAQLQAF